MIARGILFLALVCAASLVAQEPPVRILDNGTLRVPVMEPNHPERYNRGVRFTPIAAVLAVSRGGVDYLYCPEKRDPFNDHGGLAAEFDLCIPGGPVSDLPSGYEEVAPGDAFLKIGVGGLQKPKQTYNFFQNPALLEPAQTSVEWKPAGAHFRQVFAGTKTPGYSYELQAELSLDGAILSVEWSLTNTGQKPIGTRQYTHNFFRIGGQDVGTGYQLEFPYDFQALGLGEGQRQEGRTIHFDTPIPKWINAVIPSDNTVPNRLTLRHPIQRRAIICETSLPGLRTDLHARNAYIAPEQFIAITILPGKTERWTRRYSFTVE